MNPAPEPLNRPKLARWLWERNITFAAAAGVLGRSHEHIRQLCLPFGDDKRARPDETTLSRITTWTQGAVIAADFDEPKPQGGEVVSLREAHP